MLDPFEKNAAFRLAYEFIVNGDDRYYLFNAWQTSWSDRKLKKNIASITGGLDICDKLNPVTFNW